MNNRAIQEVKSIGDLVIDKLFNQDDFEIENDPEFGGTDASIGISFIYKGCNGECQVWYHAHSKTEVECLLYSNNERHENSLENLEQAVNDYIGKNLCTYELLDAMRDKARENDLDEWESHGFRDEADYIHWRYGR